MRLLGMALEAGLVEVRVGLVVPTFRDGEGKRVARITMEHIRGRWLVHPLCAKEREDSRISHPTQKPLRLVRRAILASTTVGDLVFDPLCGSGTTGVAAKELGRFFVGAEKEEEYAELAARRIGAAVRGGVLR